jgi:hypothetical protein
MMLLKLSYLHLRLGVMGARWRDFSPEMQTIIRTTAIKKLNLMITQVSYDKLLTHFTYHKVISRDLTNPVPSYVSL